MILKKIGRVAVQKAASKLRSEEGASITFALFLFLVCAVIGSVVLTAGTTASGRISRMVEMDQRYYAVISACELLKDQISDGEVTIKKTKQNVEATRYKGTLTDGEMVYTTVTPSPTPSYHYETIINGRTPVVSAENGDKNNASRGNSISFSSENDDFLTALAIKFMYRLENSSEAEKYNTDKAFEYTFKNGYPIEAKSFSFEFLKNGDDTAVFDEDALKISGTYELRNNGDLILTVSSYYGSDGSEDSNKKHKFSVELTMKAVIETNSDGTDQAEKTVTSRTDTAEGWLETETTTQSSTSTIKWKFGGIRKI